MDPADSTEEVLIRRRRRCLTDEAIVDRHGEEPEIGPLLDLERFSVVTVARAPASPMCVNDGREALAVLWVSDIGEESRSMGLTVDDVRLDHRVLSGGQSR